LGGMDGLTISVFTAEKDQVQNHAEHCHI